MKLKKKSKITLTLLSVLLSCHFMFGQVSTFYEIYDHGSSEKGYALASTQDGGYIMSGFQGLGIGVSRILIIKTDSTGQEEWHKIYGNIDHNVSWAIVALEDGGYMVGAVTSGDEFNSSEYQDIYLLRLDALGDTLWTKTYVKDGMEALWDMKICPDKGFIISGASLSPGDPYIDAYALKVDSLGNKEWDQTYFLGEKMDQFFEVEVLPDSGYVFGGETDIEDMSVDNWLVRTDALGEVIWSKNYGWEHAEISRGGMVIDAEAIILGGGTSSFVNNNHYELLLLKVDLDGDTLWTKIIGDTDDRNYTSSAITLSQAGDYLIAINDYNTVTNTDLHLIKMTNDGEVIWMQTLLDGLEFERSIDMIETSDGAIVLTGDTDNQCPNCAFLLKVTADGLLSSTLNAIAASMLPLTIYPNPTSGILNIELPNEFSGTVQLSVYDAIGKLMLRNELSAQLRRNDINLSMLNTGTYFLQLIDENGTQVSRKILLQIN